MAKRKSIKLTKAEKVKFDNILQLRKRKTGRNTSADMRDMFGY